MNNVTSLTATHIKNFMLVMILRALVELADLPHSYPDSIEFVDSWPKVVWITPDSNVKRR